tara:strand:+ start:1447 stop:1638 length:192 start_codon:yes stop_codon:yes gene_type:complete
MNVQTNDLTFSEFTEEVLILLYGNEWYKKTCTDYKSGDVFVDVDLKPVLNLLKTKLSKELINA